MKFLALLLAASLQGNPPHIHAATKAFQDGSAARTNKQFDSAISFFQKVIEIEPTFIEARKSLIQVNLAADHRLEAAKALTQLLEIEPDDFSDHILLGQLLLEQRQPERALAQFSTALSYDHNNADGLLGFATAAAKLGMEDRAKDALDRGRKLYPSDQRFLKSVKTKSVN